MPLYRGAIRVTIPFYDIEQYFDEHVTASVAHEREIRANVVIAILSAIECTRDMHNITLLAARVPGINVTVRSCSRNA